MNRDWKHDLQIGVPSPLLWALMTPAVPLLLVSCLVFGVSIRQTARICFELLRSLRGTHVEIALNHYSFLIHIA